MSISQLTCVSCQVAFLNYEVHRTHYKSDWHCYNLKRKLASLPPVTFEVFQHRMANQSPQLEEKKSQYCSKCHKNFNSVSTFENHLKSRRHLEAENKKCEEQLIKQMNQMNLEMCLKEVSEPNSKSENKSVTNLEAKTVAISKNIDDDDNDGSWEDVDSEVVTSDDETSSDIEEDKICFENKQCLFCDSVSNDIESNVRHMSLVHSFFIPDFEYLVDLDGLITYLGEKVYVDYMCLWCSSKGRRFHSTKSTQQHMVDKGHCKMLHESVNIYEYANFYDYRSSYPDQMENGNVDEEVIPQNLSDESWELVLPSGARLGHRSLARYFKQSLPLESTKNSALSKRIMSHYKTLGWTGTTGVAAVRKARDITFMNKIKSNYLVKVSVKANKLQRHFRPQVLY